MKILLPLLKILLVRLELLLIRLMLTMQKEIEDNKQNNIVWLIAQYIMSYLSFLLKAGLFVYFFITILFACSGLLALVGVDSVNSILKTILIQNFSFSWHLSGTRDFLKLASWLAIIFPLIGLIGTKIIEKVFNKKLEFIRKMMILFLICVFSSVVMGVVGFVVSNARGESISSFADALAFGGISLIFAIDIAGDRVSQKII